MSSARFSSRWNKSNKDETVEQVGFEASSLATWDEEGTFSRHWKLRSWGGNGEGSVIHQTLVGQPGETPEGSLKHQFWALEKDLGIIYSIIYLDLLIQVPELCCSLSVVLRTEVLSKRILDMYFLELHFISTDSEFPQSVFWQTLQVILCALKFDKYWGREWVISCKRKVYTP